MSGGIASSCRNILSRKYLGRRNPRAKMAKPAVIARRGRSLLEETRPRHLGNRCHLFSVITGSCISRRRPIVARKCAAGLPVAPRPAEQNEAIAWHAGEICRPCRAINLPLKSGGRTAREKSAAGAARSASTWRSRRRAGGTSRRAAWQARIDRLTAWLASCAPPSGEMPIARRRRHRPGGRRPYVIGDMGKNRRRAALSA